MAVARGLHKLIAYKDEYEVARLHLLGLRDLPEGAKVKFLLHPPVLRALGMDRKLRLGAWFIPAFRVLRAGRRLRGTALDPFGRAEVRRVERALPGEYLALVESAPAESRSPSPSWRTSCAATRTSSSPTSSASATRRTNCSVRQAARPRASWSRTRRVAGLCDSESSAPATSGRRSPATRSRPAMT